MAIELIAEPHRVDLSKTQAPEVKLVSLRLAPILSLALVLRVLAAALMFRADPQTWFYNQATELSCLAHSLLSGKGLSSPFGGTTGPSAFLAPGYPLLVAGVYRAFGARSMEAAAALTTLQIGFGVLIVLAVMLVTKRLFDSRTARVAGTLCALSPTMIWLPTLFWETSLSTLFLVVSIALALRCVDHPKPLTWIVVGAFCALGMLVNPALLITFAAIGLWAVLQAKTVSLRAPLSAVLACVVLFSVWPIRNAVALHAFVALRSNLGYELWQGNRLGSQGLFNPDLYLNANQKEFERYAAIGELPYMHEKSQIAVTEILADPTRFVRLSLKRAAIFWTALGGDGLSWIVIGEISTMSALGVSGLLLMRARRKFGNGLLLVPFLLFPLPYYLTHPDFRFRLLLEPVAILLTAWLLTESYGALKRPANEEAIKPACAPTRNLHL